MENLFVDTQFTLSSEPHTKTSKSSSNNYVGNIYYPVKIELTIETPTKSVGTGKTISSSVTKDVIEVLPGTVSLFNFNSNINFDFSLSFDFGEQQVKGRKIGRLNDVKASVSGAFGLQSIVGYLKEAIGFNYDIELSVLKARYLFMVGEIPVYVTIGPELEVFGSAEAECSFNINTLLEGVVGFHWNCNTAGEKISNFTSTEELTPIGANNNTSYNFGCSLGFDVSLYNCASLSLGFGPAYCADYKKKQISQQFSSFSDIRKVDWNLAFDIDFSILKSLEVALLKMYHTLSERVLYQSPSSIVLANDPVQTLKADELANIKYKVLGTRGDSIFPVQGALVRFVTSNGKTDSEYAYSDNHGEVNASFGLTASQPGSLIAELIGGDGDIIYSFDEIHFYQFETPDPYIPTEEDSVLYYSRPSGIDFTSVFRNTNTICGRKVLSYCDFNIKDLPENETGGKIILDGPVFYIDDSMMLSDIKTIYLPASCKEIKDGAFMGSSIERIVIAGGIESIGDAAFKTSKIKSVSIGKSVKTIGSIAFFGCSLSELPSFEEGLERINMSAFSDCEQMRGTPVFPSSLKTIGGGAFNSCSKLTGTMTIPNSLDTLGYAAFHHCSGLEKILVPIKFKEQYDLRFKDDGSYKGFEDCVFRGCNATIVYY